MCSNNFCLCGTQSGYPHKMGCPYPKYNEANTARWEEEYIRNSLQIATEDIESHGFPPTPARFQRLFGWGYTHASNVLNQLRKQRRQDELDKLITSDKVIDGVMADLEGPINKIVDDVMADMEGSIDKIVDDVIKDLGEST